MVEYITGRNGIGKTKVLLKTAIETANESTGNVIFVDCSNKLNFVLPSNIRLINPKDYGIQTAMSLHGFLVGLCASDYDLTDVFVDSMLDIFSTKNTSLTDFMEIISNTSKATGVNFHFSVKDNYEKQLTYQAV